MGNSILIIVKEIISELEYGFEKIIYKGVYRNEDMKNRKERLK